MVLDKCGKEVKVGSWVKVVYIDSGYIAALPNNEANEIKSMLHKVLKVTDIVYGKALVKLSNPPDNFRSQSLALSSEEMELIEDAP
jgi:hypothetical protein